MSSLFLEPKFQELSTLIATTVTDASSRERIEAKLAELREGLAPQNHATSRFASADENSSTAPWATDRWTSRARPTFLYVVYAMIVWAFPMGVIAAFDPDIAQAITQGMAGYLNALPETLYTLFGTGYLGYATLRQWGKIKGTDR